MSHSLLKTIGVKTPISSIAFSPDGAALIIGTENGQIMLQSLRTMNKEANKLTISTEGKRVAAISVQHKSKKTATAAPTSTSALAAGKHRSTAKPNSRLSKPLSTQDLNVKLESYARRTSHRILQPRIGTVLQNSGVGKISGRIAGTPVSTGLTRSTSMFTDPPVQRILFSSCTCSRKTTHPLTFKFVVREASLNGINNPRLLDKAPHSFLTMFVLKLPGRNISFTSRSFW